MLTSGIRSFSALAALLLFLFAWPVAAQVAQSHGGKGTVVPPTYAGPGDIVSGAIMFWGTRCYNNAYAGNTVDVVDAATGNTTGSRQTCANGIVTSLVSGAACTFVTGNACSDIATTCASACNIVTYYDQSGQTKCNSGASACDVTQATNSKRATYTAACGSNSKPCGTFLRTSNQDYTAATNHIAVNQPITMMASASRTAAFTNFQDICCGAGAELYFTNVTAQGQFSLQSNTSTAATASNSVIHNFIGIAPNTTSASAASYSIDGTIGTFTAANTTAWAAGATWLGSQSISTNTLTGQILEAGIWPSAFSSTNIADMCHNQYAYWGTGVAC